MKKFKVLYQLAGQKAWYMLEAEDAEKAEKVFLKNAKAFHGKNLMFQEFGFPIDWSDVVQKVETY